MNARRGAALAVGTFVGLPDLISRGCIQANQFSRPSGGENQIFAEQRSRSAAQNSPRSRFGRVPREFQSRADFSLVLVLTNRIKKQHIASFQGDCVSLQVLSHMNGIGGASERKNFSVQGKGEDQLGRRASIMGDELCKLRMGENMSIGGKQ